MDTVDTCPFCKASVEKYTVAEGEYARVIFSNPRVVRGHLLVTPKRHVEQPWLLTADEITEIFAHIKIFQKRLAEILGTGCDLRQNYRPFLPQSRLKVDHIHYHLIPRYNEDELYTRVQIFEKELFLELGDNERLELKTMLTGG